MTETEKTLWTNFKRNPSFKTRKEIAVKFFTLADTIAQQISRKLPSHTDLTDDLRQEGYTAILKSVEAFNPEHAAGASFTTFARQRVRGAMADYLRRCDDIPRSARERAAAVLNASDFIKATTGAEPTADEIALEMGEDPTSPEFTRKIKDSRLAKFEPIATTRIGQILDPTPQAAGRPGNDDGQRRPDAVDYWKTTMESLNPQERQVIELYYQKSMTMNEIAAEMKVSESRISRVHQNVIGRLRKAAMESPAIRQQIETLLSVN